jgi:hypothetical protein
MIGEVFDFVGNVCELVDDVNFAARKIRKAISYLFGPREKESCPVDYRDSRSAGDLRGKDPVVASCARSAPGQTSNPGYPQKATELIFRQAQDDGILK